MMLCSTLLAMLAALVALSAADYQFAGANNRWQRVTHPSTVPRIRGIWADNVGFADSHCHASFSHTHTIVLGTGGLQGECRYCAEASFRFNWVTGGCTCWCG